MITVKIDGNELSSDLSGISTMGDLIEVVKATIDPDTIITALTLGGRELTDADWRAPLSVQGGNLLEVQTGSKENFVEDRLTQSVVFANHIMHEFGFARDLFKNAQNQKANLEFGKAVEDLQAFVRWYDTLLQMFPAGGLERGEFEIKMGEIQKTCEQVLQQQLYNSWWALGETLEKRLEPQIGSLRDFCARVAGVSADAA